MMPVIRFLFSPMGRFNRLSWWAVQTVNMVLLVAIIGAFVVLLVSGAGGAAGAEATLESFEKGGAGFPLLINLAFLPMMWISFAASAKRYHDRGKTGFWYLIAIIPIIGPIWQLIELGCLPGEPGANQHGSRPGSGEAAYATDAFDVSQKAEKTEPIWKSGAKKKGRTVASVNPAIAPNAPRTSFGLRGA